ncbi:MAG: translocation/assembly module TamB domain-containing protein [Planctomycetes bacterium]|nr:translocation/assembly module TamB domain-containing protein [Planctomycetota bacterium]
MSRAAPDPNAAKRAPAPRWRRTRWVARAGLLLALLAIDLALAAYLCRSLWLAPALRRALPELLPAGVAIDFATVETDLWRGATIGGLRVTADGVALRDATLEVALDVPALLRGEPGGLRAARLRAGELAIEVASGDGEAAATPALAELAPLLELLPGGARVELGRAVVAPAGGMPWLDAPLSARLAASPARRLQVIAGGVRAECAALRDAAGAVRALHVDAELDDPAAWLARFDVTTPLAGGALRIAATTDLRSGTGEVELAGARLEDRGAAELRAALAYDGSELLVTRGVADAPGLRLQVDGLRAPLVTERLELAALRGAVALAIRDLEPWRALLPAELAARLPIRGELRGALDADGLRLDAGRLAGAGFAIDVVGGRLPPDAATTRAGELELIVALDAATRLPLPPELPPTELSGRVRVRAEGSLAAPRIDAELDLGAGQVGALRFGSVGAALAWDGERLDVAGLALRGLRSAGAPEAATLALAADARVELPPGAAPRVAAQGLAVGSPLQALAPLVGALPPELASLACEAIAFDGQADLALLDAAGGAPAAATLDLAIRGLRERADAPSAASALRARLTAVRRGAALAFVANVDGTAAAGLATLAGLGGDVLARAEPAPFAVRASGEVGDCGDVHAAGTIDLPQLATPGLPPGSARVRLAVGPTHVALEQLALRGAVDADARGTLDLAVAPPRAVLQLDARLVDAAVLQPLWPDAPDGASAALTLALDGDSTAPRIDVAASALWPDRAARAALLRWPVELGPAPRGPLTIELRLTAEPGAAPTARLLAAVGLPGEAALRASCAGRVPLRMTPGAAGSLALAAADGALDGDLLLRAAPTALGPTVLRSDFRVTRDGAELRDLALTAPQGSVRGAAQLGGGTAAWLDGTLDAAPLQGRVELGSVSLAALLPTTLGVQALAGELSGAVDAGGTAAAPRLRGTLALAGGRLKLAPEVPSLDGLEATLTAADGRVELTGLRASLGVGTLRGRASLTAPDGTFAGLARGALDVALDADDAQVLRTTGVTLRTDAHLTATGALDGALEIGGEIAVESARVIRRMSLVPDLGERGGVTVSTGIRLPAIADPLGSRIRYDVGVRTTRPAELQSYVVDLPLTAALRLRGTGAAPFLDGAVSGSDGRLRLPAITMRIDQAAATFDAADPAHPQLSIRASARRLGIDLRATAAGRLDDVELVLSSLPPLTQAEIYVLVSTGALPEQLRRQGLGSRATLVGGYVANELIDFYFGSDSTEQRDSLADRIHFEAGREVSRNGVESLMIDFDLTDAFALRGERDVWEDYNMGLVYRLRF